MIHSISKELGPIEIPNHNGKIKMLPFDLSNILDVPDKFKSVVEKMISYLPIKEGIAYLTVDSKTVEKGKSHRRGGPHIDGNYLPEEKWGSQGGGNGWKVGEGGRSLSTKEHELSYKNKTGGMLIASDYPACIGWNGIFHGESGIGGDCSNVQGLTNGFKLKANTLYYGNSQFIHESLPIDKTTHRNLIRITLPINYPVIHHAS